MSSQRPKHFAPYRYIEDVGIADTCWESPGNSLMCVFFDCLNAFRISHNRNSNTLSAVVFRRIQLSGLNSRQRVSMGFLHINAISNTSHPISLSSSLPVLATASKPSCNLKPLSKRTNRLNKSAQNIYNGEWFHFVVRYCQAHLQ